MLRTFLTQDVIAWTRGRSRGGRAGALQGCGTGAPLSRAVVVRANIAGIGHGPSVPRSRLRRLRFTTRPNGGPHR